MLGFVASAAPECSNGFPLETIYVPVSPQCLLLTKGSLCSGSGSGSSLRVDLGALGIVLRVLGVDLDALGVDILVDLGAM